MPPMTRGPLPAGVYWRRRVFVLALAATLVFVIANVLSGGSDAKDDTPAAQQASGETTASQTITVSPPKGHRGKGKRHQGGGVTQGPTFDPSVFAEPDGNCEPADVRITPRVDAAVAGRPVTVGLALQTIQSDACYFRIGPDKITLKISKGGRDIWTSRECPDAIPSQSVVVRRVVATVVQMTWDAHESDSSCSHRRQWLLPADLTVSASTLGGEPADSDFELASPPTETITPHPHQHKHPLGDQADDAGSTDSTGLTDSTGSTDSTDNPSDTSTNEPRR